MGRQKTYFDPEHLYFVTTNVMDHQPIFLRPDLAQIVIESLATIRERGWVKLYAYVLMPSHLHMLVQYGQSHTPAQVMRDFKKYTARRIVEHLQGTKDRTLLRTFQRAVRRPSKQRFKIWEDTYFDKNVYSEGFLIEKVNYIHNNPLQEGWRLVAKAEDYPYSSARNYLLGDDSVIEVDRLEGLLIPMTSQGVPDFEIRQQRSVRDAAR